MKFVRNLRKIAVFGLFLPIIASSHKTQPMKLFQPPKIVSFIPAAKYIKTTRKQPLKSTNNGLLGKFYPSISIFREQTLKQKIREMVPHLLPVILKSLQRGMKEEKLPSAKFFKTVIDRNGGNNTPDQVNIDLKNKTVTITIDDLYKIDKKTLFKLFAQEMVRLEHKNDIKNVNGAVKEFVTEELNILSQFYRTDLSVFSVVEESAHTANITGMAFNNFYRAIVISAGNQSLLYPEEGDCYGEGLVDDRGDFTAKECARKGLFFISLANALRYKKKFEGELSDLRSKAEENRKNRHLIEDELREMAYTATALKNINDILTEYKTAIDHEVGHYIMGKNTIINRTDKKFIPKKSLRRYHTRDEIKLIEEQAADSFVIPTLPRLLAAIRFHEKAIKHSQLIDGTLNQKGNLIVPKKREDVIKDHNVTTHPSPNKRVKHFEKRLNDLRNQCNQFFNTPGKLNRNISFEECIEKPNFSYVPVPLNQVRQIGDTEDIY